MRLTAHAAARALLAVLLFSCAASWSQNYPARAPCA